MRDEHCRYCGDEGGYYVIPNQTNPLIDAQSVKKSELEKLWRKCWVCERNKEAKAGRT